MIQLSSRKSISQRLRVILILIVALLVNGRIFASTLLVTSVNDVVDAPVTTPEGLTFDAGADGVVSLREAILAANAGAGADVISFSGTGNFVVQPETALPALVDPSGGTTISGDNRLVVDGLNCEGDASGLVLSSAGNVLTGATIVRFPQHGIVVAGPEAVGNAVQGCRIGTDGTLRMGNGIAGIRVESGAKNTVIGGTSEFHGNTISGNGAIGIQVVGGETSGTAILSNKIGTVIGGDYSLSNFDRLEGEGVEVNVFGGVAIDIDGATGTAIGSSITGNLFATNNAEVVRVRGDDTQIQGNMIADLPELEPTREIPIRLRSRAISLLNAKGLQVGGDAGAGNTIEGVWENYPISVRRCRDVVIVGNSILEDGQVPDPSTSACIQVIESSRVRIGGDSPSSMNLLQGRRYSVLLANDGYYGNAVLGNRFEGYEARALNVVYPTASPPGFIGGEFPRATASQCSTINVHAGSLASIDQFLGSIAVDENGAADLLALPIESIAPGDELFLTSTDDLGNTSEFSGPFSLSESLGPPVAPPANTRLPGCIGTRFSADANGDFVVDLSDLLDLISIYNSFSYHCGDGYNQYEQGPGTQDCAPHHIDRSPEDWSVNVSELLRVIQFYNFGSYQRCEGSEDGFCPGA